MVDGRHREVGALARALDKTARSDVNDSDYLGRWIDLTAHLLMQPLGHDPMLEICNELSAHFGSQATWTIDLGLDRARIGVYRSQGADARRFAPRVGDHPLALYYRATGDPYARHLAEANQFLEDSWGRALLQSLREDHLIDFVFLPLHHREGMQHRWLGLSSEEVLGAPVRDELNRLGPLVRAVDAQASVLARCFVTAPARRRVPAVELSGREITVLVLMAYGLTATAIGGRLRISPRTVSKHQQGIYRKLDVGDRLTAVMRAHALGILPRRPDGGSEGAETVEAAVDHHRTVASGTRSHAVSRSG